MWTCEEQACDGVCTAWGNSHYETFDGRIYDIEGDCQYLLARGRETSKDQFEVIVTVSLRTWKNGPPPPTGRHSVDEINNALWR